MTATSLRVPDPRDLLRSVVIWVLFIPLALLAFLAAETTQIDLVDLVNAAVYAFAGLLSVALARQSIAGVLGRILWLSIAGLCAILVLSELGGDFIEAYEAALPPAPAWLDDVACWLGAGLLLMAIAWQRTRRDLGATALWPPDGLARQRRSSPRLAERRAG